MPGLRRAVGLLFVVMVSAGCRHLADTVGTSPLRRPQMSADAVVLEIFSVRFPFGDLDANGRLWDEVDEMHLPAEVRQLLTRNGIRVGLVGGQIPAPLSKLLELKDKREPGTQPAESRLTDLEHDPRVVGRHVELRPGGHTEIIASDVVDEMSVLLCTSSGLGGEIFRAAQAVWTASVYPERDGRVRIKLVPEIQYGESRMRHVLSPGMERLEPSRSKRVFEDMSLEAVLSPGHMLILSTFPDRSGSLGHRFFSQNSAGQTDQKLLVLRIAQTQHDEVTDSVEVLSLDGLNDPPGDSPRLRERKP